MYPTGGVFVLSRCCRGRHAGKSNVFVHLAAFRLGQLPLCRASIGTSVIASLTSRIAMYEQIALTTSGGPGDDTMSLPIILVKGIMDYRYGYANAVGVVMFIIGLIVLGVVNKLFRMDEANY